MRPQNDLLEAEPPCEIWTIFSRPHFIEDTRGAQDCYVLETRDRLLTNVNNLDKWPTKHFKGENDKISFKDSDAHLVHHPHYDALVITTMMANNKVQRILVDNRSSTDILYYQPFQKMGLKVSNLKPSPNPVYRFTRDSITPMGVISLPMTMGDYPRQSCVMADFLVID